MSQLFSIGVAFFVLLGVCIHLINGDEKKKHAEFYVFHSKMPWKEHPTPITINSTSEEILEHFKGKLKCIRFLKFLIHGWSSNSSATELVAIKNEFMKQSIENFVVVLFDWSYLSKRDYLTSAKKADDCGKTLANFMLRLQLLHIYDVRYTHLICHSLGAHIAGYASECLAENGEKPCRISALDPAGPFFKTFKFAKLRSLSKKDACIVDVYHTSNIAGTYTEMGHIDTYFNGGKMQPDCKVWDVRCSHGRVLEYYLYSIKSKSENTTFIARKCDSYEHFKAGKCESNPTIIVGDGLDCSAVQGKYYLRTGKKEPYGIGLQGI